MNKTDTVLNTNPSHKVEYSLHHISVDGFAVKLNFPVSGDDTLLSDIKDILLRTLFNGSEKK